MRTRSFLLVELDQDALLHRLVEKELMFAIRAVAPKNVFRLGEELDIVDPIEHSLVRRLAVSDSGRLRNGGSDVLH